MSPGWPPVSGPAPDGQPDPSHEPNELVTAPGHGRAEREWRHATALLDDPDGVQLMLALHALRQGRRRCVQCGVLWPCEPWRIATLAQTLQTDPSPRRTGPLSWFTRPDSPG